MVSAQIMTTTRRVTASRTIVLVGHRNIVTQEQARLIDDTLSRHSVQEVIKDEPAWKRDSGWVPPLRLHLGEMPRSPDTHRIEAAESRPKVLATELVLLREAAENLEYTARWLVIHQIEPAGSLGALAPEVRRVSP